MSLVMDANDRSGERPGFDFLGHKIPTTVYDKKAHEKAKELDGQAIDVRQMANSLLTARGKDPPP